MDIRLDEPSGQLQVLEVNAQCGLSTSDSSTVGSLLNLCGQAMPPIIERVLKHGMGRAVPLFVPVFIAHAEQDGQLVNPEYEDAWVREEIDAGWVAPLRLGMGGISNSNLHMKSKK